MSVADNGDADGGRAGGSPPNDDGPLSGDSVFTWFGDRIRSRNASNVFLLVPIVAFELVFFLVPFLILLRMSVNAQSSQAFFEPAWTLNSYFAVIQSDVTMGIVLFSFKLGVIATTLSVLVGLFYAYAIYRTDGLTQASLLFAVILTLLTTLVVKTYAWRPILTPDGLVNKALLAAGVIGDPIQLAPGIVGTVIGQVYVVLPYSILAIYSVFSTLDWEIVEAARDLGASRPRSFFEVVLPEVLPGVAVATVVSFAWSVGAYAAPSQLGTGTQTTFAMEVGNLMLSNFNWPMASALAVLMLAAMLVVSVVLFRLLNRAGGGLQNV
ncbi:ABC transporter permease [Haloparvum sp. PAK95]|uniref:ABC transporter permease n=1 Tax=Haloparvum sp. PAK95 TaxID=3418962 RepID=UPI003D2EBB9E